MSETIEDILREMRDWPMHSCFVTEIGVAAYTKLKFSEFANRLDAAHKRDLKAIVDLNEIAMKTETDEVTRLREENERLKAALKPVLDCITDGIVLTNYESSCAEGFDECMNAVDAVDEAKRIYNGGAE